MLISGSGPYGSGVTKLLSLPIHQCSESFNLLLSHCLSAVLLAVREQHTLTAIILGDSHWMLYTQETTTHKKIVMIQLAATE